MTDTTLAAAPNPMTAPVYPIVSTRQSSVLPNLLRSEWAKLRSVRSTYWILGLAVVVMIGYGAVSGAAHTGVHHSSVDPVLDSLSGVTLAQFAIGILGALIITNEYSTGMIRSTFAAAPQRRSVIAAKAAVFGAAAFAVGTAASLIAFLAGQAMMGSHGVSLTSPGAARSVFGVGAYLGLLGVFAVGLGTIVRRSTGAVAALFAVILVLPALALPLPGSIHDTVVKFLPANAGQAIFTSGTGTSTLAPWTGLAVFAVYAAAVVAISLVLVRRRDA